MNDVNEATNKTFPENKKQFTHDKFLLRLISILFLIKQMSSTLKAEYSPLFFAILA